MIRLAHVSPHWRPVLRAGGTKRTDGAALRELADRLEPGLGEAFLKEIGDISDAVDLAALEAAVRARDIDAIDHLLKVPTLPKLLQPVADKLLSIFHTAGVFGAAELSPIIGADLKFDLTSPEAIRFARLETGKLIGGITDDARATVRELIAEGLSEGVPPAATARVLRETIGLSDRLAAAVMNYEQTGATAEEVAKYADELLAYRATMIARTETIRASVAGQRAAWQDAATKGYLNPAKTLRRWDAAPDACDECSELDGETVAFDDEFPDGDPPVHPACRCSVELEIE